MRATSNYRQFESKFNTRNPSPDTAVKRFFNVLLSWITTALLVGFIWGILYLMYILMERELA